MCVEQSHRSYRFFLLNSRLDDLMKFHFFIQLIVKSKIFVQSVGSPLRNHGFIRQMYPMDDYCSVQSAYHSHSQSCPKTINLYFSSKLRTHQLDPRQVCQGMLRFHLGLCSFLIRSFFHFKEILVRTGNALDRAPGRAFNVFIFLHLSEEFETSPFVFLLTQITQREILFTRYCLFCRAQFLGHTSFCALDENQKNKQKNNFKF